MSYDLLLFRFSGSVPHHRPEDESAVPIIGTPEYVRDTLAAGISGLKWLDPEFGCWEDDDLRFQAWIGDVEPVRHVYLNVYGGMATVNVITDFCRSHGWQAFDPQSGKWLDLDDPSNEGLARFERFRADVAAELGRSPVAESTNRNLSAES